jgi:hypothetical protein
MEECVLPSCQIRMWLKIHSDLHPEATNTYHNREQNFNQWSKTSHLFGYGRVRMKELRCQPGQSVEGFWLHREGTMHDSYLRQRDSVSTVSCVQGKLTHSSYSF